MVAVLLDSPYQPAAAPQYDSRPSLEVLEGGRLAAPARRPLPQRSPAVARRRRIVGAVLTASLVLGFTFALQAALRGGASGPLTTGASPAGVPAPAVTGTTADVVPAP